MAKRHSGCIAGVLRFGRMVIKDGLIIIILVLISYHEQSASAKRKNQVVCDGFRIRVFDLRFWSRPGVEGMLAGYSD